MEPGVGREQERSNLKDVLHPDVNGSKILLNTYAFLSSPLNDTFCIDDAQEAELNPESFVDSDASSFYTQRELLVQDPSQKAQATPTAGRRNAVRVSGTVIKKKKKGRMCSVPPDGVYNRSETPTLALDPTEDALRGVCSVSVDTSLDPPLDDSCHDTDSGIAWPRGEHIDTESNEDDSELDDALLGSNTLLYERLREAANTGNVTALNWLKLYKSSSGKKARRKRRTAAMETKMTPKAEDLLRRANNAYLDCNVTEAVALLEKAIKEAPGVHDPYHVLGLLYEEDLNDRGKALDCYLIAAHLIPDDYNLWSRVAVMSKSLGHTKQAIYAYRKVLRTARSVNAPVDEAAVYDLATCYISEEQFSKASEHLSFLYMRHSGDQRIAQQLAQCYHKQNLTPKALDVLYSSLASNREGLCHDSDRPSDYLCDVKAPTLLYNTASLLLLSKLLMHLKRYKECESLLLNVINEHTCLTTFPLELLVYLGTSQLYLAQTLTFYVKNAYGFLLRSTQEKHVTLPFFLLMMDAFYTAGFSSHVLTLFAQVSDLAEVRSNASMWIKVTLCQLNVSCGQPVMPASSSCFSSSSQLNPTSLDNLSPWLSSSPSSKGSRAHFLLSHVELHSLFMIFSKVVRSSDARHSLFSFIATPSSLNKGHIPRVHSALSTMATKISPAIFSWERVRMLEELQDTLPRMFEIASCEHITKEQDLSREEWIKKLLTLVQDSELDAQRVLRHNVIQRLEQLQVDVETQNVLLQELGIEGVHSDREGSSSAKNIDPLSEEKCDHRGSTHVVALPKTLSTPTTHMTSYTKTKQSLGLTSIETILGWDGYAIFLQAAVGTVMKSAGLLTQAVELLEAILDNKRTWRVQQHEPARHLFLQNIKRLSLQLSIEGGLYRVALSYIRERYLKDPHHSDRCLQAFGRLLFTGILCRTTLGQLPSSVDREALLEASRHLFIRAWCIRQLLQRPNNFMLTLLAGHFCSISGRWRLAVAEYYRAHRLGPHDELSCLTLATSLLNLAVSRVAKDRHGTLLRGFTMLLTYAKQRHATMSRIKQSIQTWGSANETIGKEDNLEQVVHCIFSSEIHYNMARYYHQISMTHLAVPLYLCCIRSLEHASVVRGVAAVHRNAMVFTNDDDDVQYIYNLLRYDVPQLQLCAMHNLSLIYRARQAFDLVEPLTQTCRVWMGKSNLNHGPG